MEVETYIYYLNHLFRDFKVTFEFNNQPKFFNFKKFAYKINESRINMLQRFVIFSIKLQ
jgi:hypothetical protein